MGNVIARVRLPLLILFPAIPWVILGASGFLVLGLCLAGTGWPEAIRISLLFGLWMGALIGVASPIYAVASPVLVTTLGVSAYNAWDRRIQDFIPWTSMKATECARLLGIQYLLVRAGDSLHVLWIDARRVGTRRPSIR